MDTRFPIWAAKWTSSADFSPFPPRASSFSDRAGRAWIAYSQGDHKLYFWRTRKGVEVDFVVYGVGGFWAIEVKNTTRVRPQDLRALRAFREDYPEAEALLLYRGTERLRIEGIWCLPGEEFLRALRPDQGLIPSAPGA